MTMLSFTICANFLAAVPDAGQYFSFIKIALSLTAFGVLARCMTWVDADLSRIHGPRTLWNSVVLTAGILAVIILLFVPNFALAVSLFAATGAAGVGSYILWRNSVVSEEDRVLTGEHLKKVLSGSELKDDEKTNLMPELNVTIQRLNGARVIAPEDNELLQTGFQLAHFLLADVLGQRATDVALIPAGQVTRLLYRIDGVTTERQRLSALDSAALLGFIKYAGNLNPAEKRVPQRGQMAIKSPAGVVPASIRTAGSSAGERMDIKVSSQAQELTLTQLRLPPDQLEQINALAKLEKGVVIVTGKRDCGVTTSLYAFLRSHDAYVQHIHAIETRPLAEIENITSHKPKVAQDGKPDMAGTLRSVLRGDPAVVLIEPVKNGATAKMILQAGRERKIYAGMANSSCFAALTEVMTLAADQNLVSKSLKGIVAVQLMRKLCPICREAYQPDPGLLKKLNIPAKKVKQLFRPPSKPLVDNKGKPIICSTCNGTGYFGRVGAFEVMILSDQVRKLIAEDASISEIKSACRKERMLYLQEQALRRVLEGLTSVAEVIRISKT